ncbi:Gliding motility regulatory protein [Candidatus Venteria ishoeyi]|uniref:histidine kinase n=2 Tax=Candidatus Venteria ishoeyi TaxID=1899563 RepID=A0A1H6FBX9_9GAMM|nr:Gliding motility regulatory protein [Candidatus Venteria ishoeyi]
MDVVHTSIKDLKGSVDIDSVPGKGTMISLTLPMSLVTEHALLIKVGKERFALPTSYLSQALASDAGKFKKVGNEISFHMEKNAYPVITLAELLHMPNVQPVTLTDERSLVLVEEEGKTTAVIVDALLDSRDLVSKTMGRYVQNVKGIAGASILGDGSVVALLDLPSLLRSPAKSISLSMSSSAGAEAADDIGIPHIMIVDDSLSVRKSLSQLVEDQGYETLLAKDGLEAIEMMGKTRPNVMLVDMEMPRMNGIELTAHVRANAATNDIPICMITSRTTEKHRTLAKDAGVSEYLTKPYQETDLLQFINASLKK